MKVKKSPLDSLSQVMMMTEALRHEVKVELLNKGPAYLSEQIDWITFTATELDVFYTSDRTDDEDKMTYAAKIGGVTEKLNLIKKALKSPVTKYNESIVGHLSINVAYAISQLRALDATMKSTLEDLCEAQ